MTGYSFTRGSTWRSTVYSARSWCSVGLYHMSAPSRAGTKVLGVLSRLLSLLVSPPPYLLESQIHLTYMVAQSSTLHHQYFCLLKGS